MIGETGGNCAMTTLSERWFGPWIQQRRAQLDELGLMWRAFRQDWLSMISLAVIILIILSAIFDPLLTPYPEQGRGEPNMIEKLDPPSREHPLGTDIMGRDMLARILFGGRTSLTLGFLVVIIGISIGTPLGAIAGYFGGRVDDVIMRLTDIFLSFPPLLLAIAITAALGPSYGNSMIAMAVVWWPWYARIVRAQTLSVKERAYVEAARGIGVRNSTIITRHILPNVTTPVLVQATIDVGAAILTGATLSFLGLGVQPPTADWGKMVDVGRTYILIAPWFVTFPGLSLFLVALSMNLLGDGIRDILDPRTRRLG
jgi:peptide/nickel transport system permease protein